MESTQNFVRTTPFVVLVSAVMIASVVMLGGVSLVVRSKRAS